MFSGKLARMGRRKLVTWRRARGLVLFGGFGVLLSVGVAWGIRHAHYVHGYPWIVGWMTSQPFLAEADERLWLLEVTQGLGRWRYGCDAFHTVPNGSRPWDPHAVVQLELVRYEFLQEAKRLRQGPVESRSESSASAYESAAAVVDRSIDSRGFDRYDWLQSVPGWVELPDLEADLYRTLTVAYGWPFPAMAEGVHNANTLGVERVWIWTPGNRDARGLRRARPILESAEFGFPIRPVWRGLLGNAAIYAAACWTAVGGVRWSWRRLRHKRGACVACGYDLAGLPKGSGCPECGAGVE